MATQTSELRYAVRWQVVLKYLGQLGLALATLTLVPCLLALGLGEYDMSLALLPPIAGLLLLALIGWHLPTPDRVQVNEGMVVVALTYLLASLLMTPPLMHTGLGFGDALFEAISGVTTTGLSTLPTLADKPATFLFIRAWMQWYGGLGIVVLSLALLVRPGLVAKGLAVNEAETDNLVGGMRTHARRILGVYLTLTGAGLLLCLLVGLDWFNGLLYTLAGVSTGGFAPVDSGLGLLSWPQQWGVTLVCLSGALPLTLYYAWGYSQRGQAGVNRLQLLTLLVMSLLLGLGVMFSLKLTTDPSWRWLLHHVPLLILSAQTTSGFASLPVSELGDGAKLLLILAMFSGGGVASTAGGIKLLRLLITLSLFRDFLVRSTLPHHALMEPTLAGRRLAQPEIQEALLLILLFLGVVVASWLPFVLAGYPPLDALFEVVSAVGTVGLSTGITDHQLPGLLKGVLCLDMLLGRLEILAWLVLIYPGSWFGNRREII